MMVRGFLLALATAAGLAQVVQAHGHMGHEAPVPRPQDCDLYHKVNVATEDANGMPTTVEHLVCATGGGQASPYYPASVMTVTVTATPAPTAMTPTGSGPTTEGQDA